MRVLLFVLPLQPRLGRETADGWLHTVEQTVALFRALAAGARRKRREPTAAQARLERRSFVLRCIAPTCFFQMKSIYFSSETSANDPDCYAPDNDNPLHSALF